MEATEVSNDKWVNKDDVVYIYSGILLSHKNEWNNAIWSDTDGPRGYPAKWSQSDWEGQWSHSTTYTWNQKTDTNEIIYKMKVDSQTQWTNLVTKQDSGSVQSLSRVQLFVTPWIAARQASLSITNSRSSLRLTSIESVMPSSHLILCHPLFLLPPIPPRIRVFPMSQFFAWGGQSTGVSASASFLPKKSQGWSPSE